MRRRSGRTPPKKVNNKPRTARSSSMGFPAPQEADRILAEAIDYAAGTDRCE
jgi:hypothetical protein